MYIGTTGPDGMHPWFWEMLLTLADRTMGGYCNDIEITVLPGNTIRVVDNGRGIPTDVHP